MGKLNGYADWANQNKELGFDLIRIYLGIALLIKGIFFIANPSELDKLIEGNIPSFAETMFLSHYIAIGHLLGGTLLAIGLLTRFAALIQLPILLGAVFFVHFKGVDKLFLGGQGIELSVIVLFLLTLYCIFGAGRYSVDHYIPHKSHKGESQYL
ncbi:MAG: hypothetical protein IEMM0008_0533 [bacterium]|nr:MAG: hypothetical protein IEMM0008_0533 [bacterium]